MGTVTLYPDSHYNESGDKTLTGGATIEAVLASGDADYVQAGTNVGLIGPYNVNLGFPTPTIPAGAKIDKLQAQLRSRRSDALEQFRLARIGYRDPTTGLFTTTGLLGSPNQAADGVIREWASAWYTGVSSGPNWNQIDPDGSDLAVTGLVNDEAGGVPYPAVARAYAVRLIVSYNERPAVSAILPSGNQATSRPTISWTYTDPEGDPKQKHRVRVFDAATYGAGGFDPAVTSPTWDSGIVNSSDNAHTVGGDLVNGTTYKAYVMVWQAPVNGEEHTSLWTAGPAFTIVLDAPAIPFLSVADDVANARIQITVNGMDNLLSANQADIETDTTGWAASTNATISRITSQASHGAASLQLASVAAGDFKATTPTGVSGMVVQPSAPYTALAKFRRISATANRNCRVDIAWYTAAGALIQTDAGSAVADNNTGWTAVTNAKTSPANAAFATLIPVVVGAAAAAEQHAVDELALLPGTSVIWTRGGLTGLFFTAVTVERSLDAGVTWEVVRGFNVIPLWTPTQLVFTPISDYEAPRGLVVQYRARVSSTLGGPYIVSGNSPVASDSQSSNQWWLKDPLDASRSMIVKVRPGVQILRPKPGDTEYPVGQTVASVSHDGMKGAVISCTIYALDRATHAALMVLLESGRTLLLQDVLGQQWYVQSGEAQLSLYAATKLAAESTPIRHAHEIDLTFTEVGAP